MNILLRLKHFIITVAVLLGGTIAIGITSYYLLFFSIAFMAIVTHKAMDAFLGIVVPLSHFGAAAIIAGSVIAIINSLVLPYRRWSLAIFSGMFVGSVIAAVSSALGKKAVSFIVWLCGFVIQLKI